MMDEITHGAFGGLVRKRTGEQVSINPIEQQPKAKLVRLREVGVGNTFQIAGKLYKKLTQVDAHNLVAVLRLGRGPTTRPVMTGDQLVEV